MQNRNEISRFRDPAFSRRAFSFVEVLIAIAVAAAVITAAALVYQAISASGNRLATYGAVTIGATANQAFYGQSNAAINTFYGPNFGRLALAEQMRDGLYRDLQRASAVFCLGRTGLGGFRPTSITIDAGIDARQLATPEAFRAYLAASVPATASMFTAYRGVSTSSNFSIFVIAPSGSATNLSVQSVYEMDLLNTTSPEGVYASVRRYEGGMMTAFYDVFYAGEGQTFGPPLANFERRARQATIETDAIDAFKRAANRPFYFVWWPDPSLPRLDVGPSSGATTTDPRSYYDAMGGQTSLFFVLPMFPSL